MLLIATVFTLNSCGSQTIKIQDCIDVRFEPAYNGYAKSILEIDEDSLNELMNPDKTIRFIEELLKSNEDYRDMSVDIVELLSEEPELIPGFTKSTSNNSKNHERLLSFRIYIAE